MTARPILMSAPMVQALLAVRKTQTRRIVKPQPEDCGKVWRWQDGRKAFVASTGKGLEPGLLLVCPYGKPGDLLWVRETWTEGTDGTDCGAYRWPIYAEEYRDGSGAYRVLKPWRPSIHMPRKYSRLTLEMTEVRVERLQDITEEDAIAEGCFFTDYGRPCYHHGNNGYENTALCAAPDEHHPRNPGWMWKETTGHQQCMNTARGAFGNLWNTINGPDSWNANPWLWALTFHVHRCNVDDLLKQRAA